MIRICDVLFASAMLIALLPLMLVVALAVFITDPGNVFFGHERIGRHGRRFKCYKFRTMVKDAEARLQSLLDADPDRRRAWERDQKLFDDPRITPVGGFLRVWSLDELPQLWNVLRGDMSLVGPRPIVSAEIGRYGRYIWDYYRVRPGITGLWQISGRNDISYRRRVALDVAFARSQCFALYLRILWLTVPAVLLTKGSY